MSMKQKTLLDNLIYYVLGATVLLALKWFCSIATLSALTFVLLPVSTFVGLILGLDFEFIDQLGYVNQEVQVAINASCSGMTFMIITYATCYFLFVHRFKTHTHKIVWIPLSILIAYVYTLINNSLRIVLSIKLLKATFYNDFITYDLVHMILGIVIYVCALLILYIIVNHVLTKSTPLSASTLYYPLLAYLIITICLPMLNGALLKDFEGFINYALTVTVFGIISLTLIKSIFFVLKRHFGFKQFAQISRTKD